MRRTRAVLLAGALVLGAPACGVTAEDEARPLASVDVPARLEPGAPPTPALGQGVQRLYFVAEDELVPVVRPARATSPRATLADLLAGPSAQERSRGLGTALPPAPAQPPGVALSGGIAEVELPSDLVDAGRTDQVQALAQIVLSLTALPGVDGVRFRQGAEPLAVPRADGVLDVGPLSRLDYQELLS